MKYTYLIVIVILIVKLSFGQNIGAPAPDLTLLNTENEEFKLSDHQGKAIAVFFFGYACPLCIAISPDVQSKIANTFKTNDDSMIIGIDTWDGSTAQVNNFVNTTNLDFEVLQQGSQIAKLWETTYDRLVIIDREGKMAFKGAGLASNHIDQAISALEVTLNNTKTSLFRIENSNKNELSIFPNPVTDKASVNFNLIESQKVEIVIYDLSGKTVYHDVKLFNEGSTSVSIDGSNFNRGIHMLKLNTNNYSSFKRFTVR